MLSGRERSTAVINLICSPCECLDKVHAIVSLLEFHGAPRDCEIVSFRGLFVSASRPRSHSSQL